MENIYKKRERKREGKRTEKIKRKRNLSIKFAFDFIFVASCNSKGREGRMEIRKSSGIDRVTKRREGGEGAPNTREDHGARAVNTNLSTRKKENERDAKSLQVGGGEGPLSMNRERGMHRETVKGRERERGGRRRRSGRSGVEIRFTGVV